MEINIADVVAEVSDAFMRYEKALCANDLDSIDGLFWKSSLTLRYGPNGTLLGHAAISTFPAGTRHQGDGPSFEEYRCHDVRP
jgi:Protein of unknown function (DUF3225)